MKPNNPYLINLSSSEYPRWVFATWVRPAQIMRFHIFKIHGAHEVTIHDSAVRSPTAAELKTYARLDAGTIRQGDPEAPEGRGGTAPSGAGT